MFRHEVLTAIAEQRVIGIVRTTTAEEALQMTLRLVDAGLRAVEVALTTPGAVDVVAEVAGARPYAVVGAGTVLDAASCQQVVRAGARFVVAPTLDRATLRTARRHGAAAVPGIATPTEALTALEEGADAVKLFPASAVAPSWVREVRAALPQLPVVPTGGIGVDQPGEWIRAGAVAVGLGSALTAADDPAAAVQQALRSARAGVTRGT